MNILCKLRIHDWLILSHRHEDNMHIFERVCPKCMYTERVEIVR